MTDAQPARLAVVLSDEDLWVLTFASFFRRSGLGWVGHRPPSALMRAAGLQRPGWQVDSAALLAFLVSCPAQSSSPREGRGTFS